MRTAFAPIWAATDELVLTVAETDFLWEEQVVYHQLNKSDSIAWGLFKDGMRALTIRRGAEAEELPRFLATINRARFLPADAGDDLLTLLWEQEFRVHPVQFIEFFGEGGGALPEQTGSYNAGGSDEHEAAPASCPGGGGGPAAPERRRRVEDFDSTLYFLDEDEISYARAASCRRNTARRPGQRAQRAVRSVRVQPEAGDPR